MQPFDCDDEALRCISTAEHHLCDRDYDQCKLYASRVRESDMRRAQAEQILAIADTLDTCDKKRGKHHLDWYGLLKVENNCVDSELMESNYRRLIGLLDPRNNSFPFADNAFRLVKEAWNVLTNPATKFEYDEFLRNEGTGFAGYNFIQGDMGRGMGTGASSGIGVGVGMQQQQQPQQRNGTSSGIGVGMGLQQQQHNGSTHYNFIQEHSEQLQKQHHHQQHFPQQFGEQQLFPNQRVEYLNEGQQVVQQQNWANQGHQQPQVQQQPVHWSQNHQVPQQQIHWSQLQPEQAGLHWSQLQQQQNQHQSLPRQTQQQQVLNRGQPQQLLPQRSPPPQPQQVPSQQVEQHWPLQQQPLPWHHSQAQQQKTFRQPTPPPQTQPEQSWPKHQPQSQPAIQQPLPWHHSQSQQPSAVPLQHKLLRQPTPPPQQPTPPAQSHQPQTQLLLPKSPPPRQQQQALPQSQLYHPVAQQHLPWQHSQQQNPLTRAEPEPLMPLHQPTPPEKPLHQPTPPPQNPLRQPTPTPQNPIRQPTPPPQNPLRQPTPPPQNPLLQPMPTPKVQKIVNQLPVPKLEPQPQEQLPIASHQSRQQPSPRTQLQQPLSHSPPPPQQQPPLPLPEPSLPKTQPIAPQPMLKPVPVPVVQLPSSNPKSPLTGCEKLQHQTQTISEPQLQLQPQLQSQPLQQESQTIQPQPKSQEKSQPPSKEKLKPPPKSQAKLKPLQKSKPQTQSLKSPAESQIHGENEKSLEAGQQARPVAGEESGQIDGNQQTDISSFWTGCPYCYHMYEYPKRYVECTLLCQTCKRAFHAVEFSTPPSAADGKDAYFCTWAFFPFGVSESYFNRRNAEASTWNPISNMFVVPQGENSCHVGKQKSKKPNAGPWVYIDDDQDHVQDVPPKEDSDEDWDSTKEKKKKRARSPKGKDSTSKKVKSPKVNKSKKVKRGNTGNSQPVRAAEEGEGFGVPDVEVPSIPVGTTSNREASVITSNRPGGVAKDMGKLDLNVEFSNEVEEPGKGTSGGSTAEQGVEDNAEGTAFFDDLDEFLESLPIFSVDGDGKAKAG
ncbi:uncharacterized protein LOC141661898 [Apium graveolens]|uniref:uncharacterized protein LOC141661898 n=1 Tax=Apium graveolens TaxID=4045 RepID=UPI003D7B9537